MGPEHFFKSGMWIIPIVMMIVCFLLFKFGLFTRRNRSEEYNLNSKQPQSNETAEDILKKRYARGEISKAEFEQMKRDL